MLDKINKKEAIKFLKQKLIETRSRIIKAKHIYKQNQRIMTPWWQSLNRENMTRIVKEGLPIPKKPDVLPFPKYDDDERRNGYIMFSWAEIDTVTCMHIVYNKIRGSKQHTKDDTKYENTSHYQAILERLQNLFPLQDSAVTREGANNDSKS